MNAPAFDLARAVLHSPAYEGPINDLAVTVLADSADPLDKATVHMLRHHTWPEQTEEFAEFYAERRTEDRSTLRLIAAAMIFAAIVLLAVIAERAWTEANAAAIERIVG